MNLDDPTWLSLKGGYRVPYDPRKALALLERGANDDNVWKELWNELHHQGDVGEASYAAVPHLVRIYEARGIADWNMYALATTIDLARRDARNPPLPEFLREDYESAWRRLAELAVRDFGAADGDELVSSILGVLAISKGQIALGALASGFSEDELIKLVGREMAFPKRMQKIEFTYPSDFDERGRLESEWRGALDNVKVKIDGNETYSIDFITPIRLVQDFEQMKKAGEPWLGCAAVILVTEVRQETIEKAATALLRTDFFYQLGAHE